MKKHFTRLLFLLLVCSLLGCTAAESPSIGSSGVSHDPDFCTVPSAPVSAPTESGVPTPEGSFTIHFIDVGQADAALVQCDGHYMLIDGGNRADSSRIYAILKKEAVTSLELVVGTHSHEDHIGGLPGALSFAAAGKTLCPVTFYESEVFDTFAHYADRFGGGITVPAAGDTYSLGSATVTILGLNQGSSVNDSSIVLRIDYGHTSFLFTGDAETEAEQALLNSGAKISATVLKVGHHGSDTSTGYAFLRQIQPAYAVISCGSGNAYGHPSETVLSRLRDAEVQVFRTDLQGDIFCSSDGETVAFRVSRNSGIDTLDFPGNRDPVPLTTGAGTKMNYILNTSTMKFHFPDCPSVAQMAEENQKTVVCFREELIAEGYAACKRCCP